MIAAIIVAVALLRLPRPALNAQNIATARPVRPAPRWPDGRIRLSSPAGEAGLWGGSGRLAVNPRSYEPRPTLNAPIHIDNVPLQPWARALLDDRHLNFLKDEPYTRCKPSPGPRLWTTAYGFEIVDSPERQNIYVFNNGGAHSFHTIFMDGRKHPEARDLVPSYYGHSIGHWESDTLVIDTVGFNERAWMNRDGLPSTDKLHLIERLTRTDFDTLKYEVTIDDLGAYTAVWSSGFSLRLAAGDELFEYLCQDNNHGPEMMVGSGNTVDRSSPIVP
jgi:hypothetical protein